MSDEIEISDKDITNDVRGLGKPAPSPLIAKVMETVKALENEQEQEKEPSREELDQIFNRNSDKEKDNELER